MTSLLRIAGAGGSEERRRRARPDESETLSGKPSCASGKVLDFDNAIPVRPRAVGVLARLAGAILAVGILVAAFVAGYRLFAVWAGLAALSWMFVFGACKASDQ